MSPAAATGRSTGSLCPLGFPHPAPSWLWCVTVWTRPRSRDPAAAPEVPGKRLSVGLPDQSQEEVREQGPPWAPGQVLAALPLCSRLVRSPPARSRREAKALQDTWGRVSVSCPEGGQLEEPARVRGEC